jgi:hypothetical protein
MSKTNITGNGVLRHFFSGARETYFDGKRNTEAAGILRASGEGSADAQQEILTEWASANNCLLTRQEYDEIKNFTFIGSGIEAKVFLHPEGTHVVKVVDYSIFSKTPLASLDNKIAMHNMIFEETAYTLLGIANFTDSSDNRKFHLIIAQPFIYGEELPTYQEIEKWMVKRGFTGDSTTHAVNHVKFHHSYILRDCNNSISVRISDAHPRNFIKRMSGRTAEIYCIDPVISNNSVNINISS